MCICDFWLAYFENLEKLIIFTIKGINLILTYSSGFMVNLIYEWRILKTNTLGN